MTQPEMHIDGGVPISEVIRRQQEREIPRRERTEREILIDIADLLTRQLGETQHIRAALTALNEGTALFQGAAASRSSVQLEQGAKEVRLTVKLYESSLLGTLGDDAVAEFGRLFRLIEQQQMAGWAETVEAVRNGV